MDFETIFKINIFLSRILGDLYGKKTQEFDITYVPVVMNQKWGKKLQIFTQNMSL